MPADLHAERRRQQRCLRPRTVRPVARGTVSSWNQDRGRGPAPGLLVRHGGSDPTTLRRPIMRISRKAIASVIAALAAALLVAACGGDKKTEFKVDDPSPDNKLFHVGADATRFGGPVPLSVKLFSTPYNAKGKVHWRWRF